MKVYQKVASVRTDMVLFYCIVLLDAECLFLLGKAQLKHLLLDLICGGDILIHIRTHNAIKIQKLKNNSTFFFFFLSEHHVSLANLHLSPMCGKTFSSSSHLLIFNLHSFPLNYNPN